MSEHQNFDVDIYSGHLERLVVNSGAERRWRAARRLLRTLASFGRKSQV